MKNSQILEVTNVRTSTPEGNPLKDKNGREYRVVEFSTPSTQYMTIGNRQIPVKVEPKTTAVTRYKESYLNDKAQFGFDIKVGEFVLGDIATRQVEEYTIISKDGTERAVNTYSTVVFGDSADAGWEAKVKIAFKSAGHIIVEEQAQFVQPQRVFQEEEMPI